MSVYDSFQTRVVVVVWKGARAHTHTYNIRRSRPFDYASACVRVCPRRNAEWGLCPPELDKRRYDYADTLEPNAARPLADVTRRRDLAWGGCGAEGIRPVENCTCARSRRRTRWTAGKFVVVGGGHTGWLTWREGTISVAGVRRNGERQGEVDARNGVHARCARVRRGGARFGRRSVYNSGSSVALATFRVQYLSFFFFFFFF